MSLNLNRHSAVFRPRCLLVNNDGNDGNQLQGEVTPETFLAQRTTALAGTQVSSIFYCTGVVNQYTHLSAETEFRGDYDRWSFAQSLKAQGTDTLEVMAQFCRANQLEIFWSMRMNDTHDYQREINFTRWKREHPDYLLGKAGDKIPWNTTDDWPARWSALDYQQAGVREKITRILHDVCSRYDLDGIELDFFRHPIFFKTQYHGEPVTPEQRDLMTDLVAQIRAMTRQIEAQRGRPLLLAVRIPDSIGYCREIGLDVERWLEENQVDLLIGSGYFQLEFWPNFVALGKKYEVPVYACLSGSRFVNPHNNREKLPLENWRGEALTAWEAGVDGIYLFNVFDPNDSRLRELGDPDGLRQTNPPRQAITGSLWRPDYWLKNGSRFRRLQTASNK